jgi:hypothetical protein
MGGIHWFSSRTVKELQHPKLLSPIGDTNEKTSFTFRFALPFSLWSLSRSPSLYPSRAPTLHQIFLAPPSASLRPSLSQSGPPSTGGHPFLHRRRHPSKVGRVAAREPCAHESSHADARPHPRKLGAHRGGAV